MNTKSMTLISGLLLLITSGPCLGLYGVLDVSTTEANELGVTIRTNQNGDAGIRVSMELKATGKLKKFTHVEVRIGEGKDRIMSAPLQDSDPGEENVAVHFSVDPAYLHMSTLWVYVADGLDGGTVYRFKAKDFI